MLRAAATAQIALLFLALAIPSYAQTEVWLSEGERGVVECAVSDGAAVRWSREGGEGGALDPRWTSGERRGPAGVVATLTAVVAPGMGGHYRCAPPPAPYIHVRVRHNHSGAATVASPSEVSLASNVVMYDIRGNLSLRCPLSGSPVSWSKNGTALEQIPELTARSELTEDGAVFSIRGRALEADWGNYSCGAQGDSHVWDVRGRPVAHLPDNTNVVEGQRLRLVCTLKGLPYPAVQWTFTNATLNMSDVTAALGGRAVLETSDQGVEGAALLVESALREDAGEYVCTPAGGVASVTVVRVKDMYAALWPFLGICAEVFVLCAVILIYERRRTKPEMDDSDTDHDQKKS